MRTPSRELGGSYKWIALSNTTLGMLMATINSSIVLISLPAIFRGIALDPLTPTNIGYLLWMLMGYMVVTAVLVVGLGRVGDMFGRVRMYNFGFAIFTLGSIGLSLVLWQGPSAALTLIGLRIVQGIGGAMVMANSTAILTDAFPPNQRGTALGINSVAAIAGSFLGLVIGGLLSTSDWHLVFLVSVPVGVFGTIWGFMKLREIGTVRRGRMDWWGNATFAAGLILVLVGITYGIQPYGGGNMGWTNPTVLAELIGGVLLLALFVLIETRVAEPMFDLGLFKIPTFTAGNLAGLLASIGRGGLMFMLIIWLQGIWLPLHGYSFEQTPLWSAIYMLPMTLGFLIAGPLSGFLSDHFGARLFATGGMVAAAATFGLMMLLPADFSYPVFGALLLMNGLSMGLFAAPNTAGIMNAVPPDRRGVASGMRATFQNAGMNLSIGLFFSLMIVGLSGALPGSLFNGLTQAGVPAAVAGRISHLPPVSTLFAAFLGYNPMQMLLGPVLAHLPADRVAFLTGGSFFPNLIADPFMQGMRLTFLFAMIAMLVAGLASWLMGNPARQATRVMPQPVSPAASRQPSAPPVVAISASYGAGGTEVASRVARFLRVPFVDRVLSGDAAWQLAETTGGVILDQPAARVLNGHPAALRVRLDGSLDRRLQRAVVDERIDLDEARRRQRLIDDPSETDPSLYDLVLDSTRLSPQACAALIATAAWTVAGSAASDVPAAVDGAVAIAQSA
jgi:MFS family permease